MIVQTNFAQQAALGVRQIFEHLGFCLRIPPAGIVRMHADSGIQKRVFFRQGKHLVLVWRILAGVRHHQRALHPGLPEAFDDRFPIFVKLPIRNMAVRIK